MVLISHVVKEEGVIEGVMSVCSLSQSFTDTLAQVIILGDSGVGKTSLMNQYVCLPIYLPSRLDFLLTQ